MADDHPALLDANVLVALTWPQHVHHARAQAWLGPRASLHGPACRGRARIRRRSARSPGDPRRHPDHRFIEDATSLAEPAIDLRSLAGRAQVTDLHLVNPRAGAGAVLAALDAALVDALRSVDRRHALLLPPG